MNNILAYNGYRAVIEFSAEDMALFGKVLDIDDKIIFEIDAPDKAESVFHEVIDDYLKICKKNTPKSDTNKLRLALQALSSSVLEMPAKKQDIISDWFFTWARYLKFEKTFKPERLKYYKRGDIVHAHFGFNVGNEQGGTHYAVVVDNNNNKASGCIVVVPISSIEAGKTADSLHGSEVYLGKIIPNSDTESYAQPLQIRCVSKLRIIKPKSDSDTNYILSAEQMDMIDNKIVELFTKKHLTKR